MLKLNLLMCVTVFVRGDLIGVAGITIYINGLGNITNQVYQALSSRTTGYSPVAPDIALNATNCSVVVSNHLKYNVAIGVRFYTFSLVI